MKKSKTLLTILTMGIASLSMATALIISPVSAQPLPSGKTFVKGIDLTKACTQQTGIPYAVININGDVMGWRCQYRMYIEGRLVYKNMPIDLTIYCQRNHKGSKPYYTDFQDEYSWGCYR